ncbi:MAG: cyclic nucleotide-binding domain-containing protein [Desulfotignum sp.]|nr:cyclic nucleotide-binding domain-containing protein [Desulfotignum sp.]MCF8089454.1 cyclic nucleotide-binding domain-containing protein [Desulfotignum sp.]MCF8139170.1 cyclic nucleotide-binding domain-containing protein [Desulfotignum sp.]
MVKIQDLKHIHMLEQMPAHLLALIGQEAQLSIFSSGTCLFKAGEKVGTFYMVIMGQVALTVALNPDIDVVLENIQSGRTFGSSALISGGPATYTAICQEPCETITLSGSRMQKLFETNDELAFYLMAGVARQYKNSMDTRAKMILKTLARHPEMKASIHDIDTLTPAY